MKEYFLSMVASSIVLSIAFLQCTSSATTNPQVTNQEVAALPMKATEPKSIAKPIPIAKLIPVDKPIPIAKPTPVNKPIPIAKPTPVDEPKPIAKPIPIDEPTPIAKPIPIDEPASLRSSGFTLKLLKATINGTSTLHDWESQVTEIEGKGSFQIKDKLLAAIQDAEIKITVKGIKSKEGKKMDNKTYEAFKSEENPFIVYSFSNAAVKISDSHVVTIEAAGNLSMAGTSEPVSLSANGKELPNGDLQLTVSKKIKMTDYNMEPPVMFFGTIKVGDEITVSFDFELSKLQK